MLNFKPMDICVFCKEKPTTSSSIEHIVPESLGNKTHVLPKGTVCDRCNSYFALKVEKKALETDFFRSLRHRNRIESKKGKIPRGEAIIPKTNYKAELSIPKKLEEPIRVRLDAKSYELFAKGEIDYLILPWRSKLPIGDQSVSRLLAKIGYEMMVFSLLEKEDLLIELVKDYQLDPLREYVRINSRNQIWDYNIRQIYKENERFYTYDGDQFDMVFESTFLTTDESELYFVIAFKGFEFVINIGGHSTDGFRRWLRKYNDISPLYIDGKNFGMQLTPEFLRNQ